jgi:hypothetical protein
VAIPRLGTEIRSDGVWACLTAETPNEHWSVGMEAFGVELDAATDAYRGERGDRTPFGLDLEWTAVSEPYDYPGLSRYEQSCDVHGEILVGDDRIELAGTGQRDHSWGVRDWWTTSWCWTAGALGDGTRFHASKPDVGFKYEPGYVVEPGGALTGLFDFTVETVEGDERVPTSAAMHVGPLELSVTPIGMAPILLDDGAGRVGRFPRSLCRFDTADGRTGYGWTEWNQPPAPGDPAGAAGSG